MLVLCSALERLDVEACRGCEQDPFFNFVLDAEKFFVPGLWSL
jgi:hypothetical protein